MPGSEGNGSNGRPPDDLSAILQNVKTQVARGVPDRKRAPAETTSAAIVPFEFEEKRVRTVTRDGAMWFVAADVCRVLEISKHRDAVARLFEDERGLVLVDTLGGPQEVAAVSESGLNALIMRSRKPSAQRFRKWVTAEVLPQIRRTGSYRRPDSDAEAMHRALSDPAVLRGLLGEYVEKVRVAEERLAIAAPKATTLDTMLATSAPAPNADIAAQCALVKALGSTHELHAEIVARTGTKLRIHSVRVWRYRGISRHWRPLIAALATERRLPVPKGFLAPLPETPEPPAPIARHPSDDRWPA